MKLMIHGKERDINLLKPNAKISNNIIFMHITGFDCFEKYTNILKIIDGIEIKPDKFKGEDRLFDWEDGKFVYNKQNFDRIKCFADKYNLKVQFHLPFYKIEGKSLALEKEEDHDTFLKVFEQYAKVIDDYKLGTTNITIHPPVLEDCSNFDIIKLALENANKLFIKLGEKIKVDNWNMVIGVENQPMPKTYKNDVYSLGYELDHFNIMLHHTNDYIQITVDSGHRLLADDFSVNRLANWCIENKKYITNFHFHQNNGPDYEKVAQGKSSDLHHIAVKDGMNGYYRYLMTSVLECIPLNMEIKFSNYKTEQILDYVTNLRSDVDDVYREIKNQ